MASPPKQKPDRNQYALAIGWVCMETAHIDKLVVDLITHLAGVDLEGTECLLSKSDRLDSRCEIAKRLLILRTPDGEWRDMALKVLEFVQNEVCPRRNRYVHDVWRFDDHPTRVRRTAEAKRRQSRSPLEIVTTIECVVPIEDLHELVYACASIPSALVGIRIAYQRHLLSGMPLEEHAWPLREMSTYKFRDNFRSGGKGQHPPRPSSLP